MSQCTRRQPDGLGLQHQLLLDEATGSIIAPRTLLFSPPGTIWTLQFRQIWTLRCHFVRDTTFLNFSKTILGYNKKTGAMAAIVTCR